MKALSSSASTPSLKSPPPALVAELPLRMTSCSRRVAVASLNRPPPKSDRPLFSVTPERVTVADTTWRMRKSGVPIASLRCTVSVCPRFHWPNLYGPVPTGLSFANFWIAAAFIPCQMCWGMIGIESPGSNACGDENVTTTSGPCVPMSFIASSHWAYCESFWSAISENVNTTSSAENGWPSCHVTPCWR